MRNPILHSFLRTEIRLLLVAALFALFVMTVLFIAPVFVTGDSRFGVLADMTIVSKVVIPMTLSAGLVLLGTVINALVHAARSFTH